VTENGSFEFLAGKVTKNESLDFLAGKLNLIKTTRKRSLVGKQGAVTV
jgi:hypothetical protein